MNPIRIGIAGGGRMGQAISRLIDAADDLQLAGVWKRGDTLDKVLASCDVLVDFTLPEATGTVLEAVVRCDTPLVCGVSGLSDAQFEALDRAAESVAIVYDRNMSAGVAVLEKLVREAAASLGPEFNVEVHETHHVHKVDAPSGTALKLGEAIADSRGTDARDIHYESERRGEVPGDHSVLFTSETERVTLEHSVTTRDVFAAGALRAARWIVGRGPGRFTMHDVLE